MLAAEVRLGTTEALLPRAEQLPEETFRAGQPIRAVIRTMPELGQGSRIILSRTHPDFLRRLFESRGPSRSPTRASRSRAGGEAIRSKVAVRPSSANIDPVTACVAPGAPVSMQISSTSSEASFRDLSAVPIPDLVGRIEGLSEALAARFIAQAERLAEDS